MRKAECGRYENDRIICMVELDAIAIHETDGRMRTEGRDGELLQQISPNLKIRILLMFRFICPRLPALLFPSLTVAATCRSRLMMQLLRLPIVLGRFICRPLLRGKSGWSRDACSSLSGSRGLLFRGPRRCGRVCMVLLRILSYFLSVIKSHCERLLQAHRSLSTEIGRASCRERVCR